MGKIIPWEAIDERNLLPKGIYECAIREITDERTKGGGALDAGCLMYGVSYEVVASEPAGLENRVLFDRFPVGTNDDPHADEPETWKKPGGPQRLKKMLISANIELVPDMDDVKAAAKNQHLLLTVGTRKTERDTELNDVKGYHLVGSRNLFTDSNGHGSNGGGTVTATKAPTKKATKRAAKKKVDTIQCPECEEVVKYADYPDHQDKFHGDESE